MNSKLITRYEDKPIYRDKDYLPVFFLFLSLIGFVVYTLYVDMNSIELNYETSFNGRVINTFNQKSTYYLRLSNEDKWIKLEGFYNNSKPRMNTSGWFVNLFYKGDIVHKNKNSNQMNLIRNNEKFSFILENLNQD
ncbi:hypothetical protein [Gaetbulibacter saemankumensis]|uniref:hypothetical protein n=1 Tax=Gaetbulibacter saemankumensis TaxID=311208 RepID=UPI00042107A7|nr:hypothetical protein [Gaetbulibacter saemankumensis]